MNIYEWQRRSSDTSTAESGSDADDHDSPAIDVTAEYTRLAPVHEEVSLIHLSNRHSLIWFSISHFIWA